MTMGRTNRHSYDRSGSDHDLDDNDTDDYEDRDDYEDDNLRDVSEMNSERW